MKKYVVVGLAAFFSILLIGAISVNTVVASTAPQWLPENEDISDWVILKIPVILISLP